MNIIPRALLLFTLVSGLAAPARAQEALAVQPPPAVGTAAGVLVDGSTGALYWSRDHLTQRPPASLTKIATALVVLERISDLDETAQISAEARNVPGGKLGAEEGWTFTVRDLLWGLLLRSGNDFAVAVAQKASPDGTVAGFSALMNDKAKALGATGSSFVNPHGMDEPGHLSTARDLALLTVAALRNPVFAEIVGTERHAIAWNGGVLDLENSNRLIFRYPGTIGVKTGFTAGAGRSLVSAARRDGFTMVAVALDSPDPYGESATLFDWGFDNRDALRARPPAETVLPPAPKPAAKPAATRQGGLDVVEVDGGSVPAAVPAQRERGGGLAAPALGMGVAGTAWWLTARRRRRRRAAFSSVEEFQEALRALGSGRVD